MTREKMVIGRVEEVVLPNIGNETVHARIDTGARTSSIWATDIIEEEGLLKVRFMSPGHALYEQEVLFENYDRVRVASSMGQQETRYRVKMPIVISKRRIMAKFTLSDRSQQVYPVLIGRSALMNKFVVDVSKGSPLKETETSRSKMLQDNIEGEDEL